jgi:hypothetical protein
VRNRSQDDQQFTIRVDHPETVQNLRETRIPFQLINRTFAQALLMMQLRIHIGNGQARIEFDRTFRDLTGIDDQIVSVTDRIKDINLVDFRVTIGVLRSRSGGKMLGAADAVVSPRHSAATTAATGGCPLLHERAAPLDMPQTPSYGPHSLGPRGGGTNASIACHFTCPQPVASVEVVRHFGPACLPRLLDGRPHEPGLPCLVQLDDQESAPTLSRAPSSATVAPCDTTKLLAQIVARA